MKISDFLKYGAHAAITSQELQDVTGLNGTQIRRAIHAERLKGVPILSNCTTGNAGYYLADLESDKKLFVRSMKHRALEILKVAGAVDRAQIPGTEPQNGGQQP